MAKTKKNQFTSQLKKVYKNLFKIPFNLEIDDNDFNVLFKIKN